MKRVLIIVLAIVAVLVVSFGLAIALGGPGEPPPMSSINDPFKNVDFSDLPELSHFTARDGAKVAFRAYPAGGDAIKGSVVLVHGSSASSSSMHVMATGFAAAGYAVYAMDMRGHGQSGAKGDIAYIGQLEDDMEDFLHAIKLAQASTLVGVLFRRRFRASLCGQSTSGTILQLSSSFSLDQSGRSNVASGQRRLGYRGGSAHHRDRRAKRVWNACV